MSLGLLRQSLRRNRREFAFSSVGIVVGIATLFFFTSLGEGIRTTVLERVFVIGQLEVVPPSYDVGAFRTQGGLFGSGGLSDRTVLRLSEIEGVAAVYPKMKLTFPASARGGRELLGQDMMAELIADGIPESLIESSVDEVLSFRDYEAFACEVDDACPPGFTCEDGICAPGECRTDDQCEGIAYCADRQHCAMPIPIVISPYLLEVYNGSVHTALRGARGPGSRLPQLSEEALIGFTFEAVFGRSYLGSAETGGTMQRKMRIVGFSDRALQLGVTMPIGYVKRLNQHFGQKTADEYHSILVEAASNDRIASIAHTVVEEMGLALSDRYETAQRAGLLIFLITLVFNLIGLVILLIAAVNIMHTFSMIVMERRREIAVMRAVGATPGHIRKLLLMEATVLGAIGGVVGLGLGFGATVAVDMAFHSMVAEFPFKPDTLFGAHLWMPFAAVAIAIIFCQLGALIPAFRASNADAAAALAGR